MRHGKHDTYMWMYVEKTGKQLPLYVADSASELAEKIGVSPSTVVSSVMYAEKRGGDSRYIRVEMSQEDWDWCHKED